MTRVQSLRNLMQLSRKKIELLYGISASSIERWEQGKQMTDTSINRLILAAKAHGISCSHEWLKSGAGMAPSYQKTACIPEFIRKYLNASKNKILVPYKVPDASMQPRFFSDEWLITQRLDITEAGLATNNICVVDTNDGRFLRLLKPSNTPGLYNLICTNYTSNSRSLYEQEITAIAIIICHFINT